MHRLAIVLSAALGIAAVGGLARAEEPAVEPAKAPTPQPLAAPVPEAASVPAADPEPLEPARTVDTGWARASAIVGFVSAGVVFGLTAGAGVTVHDDEPTSPVLGGVGLLLAVAWVPVTYVAGDDLREALPGPPRSAGLRISSWVFYGLAAAEAVAQGIMVGSGVRPIEALVWTYGGLAATSLVLMSLDTILTVGDAQDRPDGGGPEQALRFRPAVVPVFDLEGRNTVGATLGLTGRF